MVPVLMSGESAEEGDRGESERLRLDGDLSSAELYPVSRLCKLSPSLEPLGLLLGDPLGKCTLNPDLRVGLLLLLLS